MSTSPIRAVILAGGFGTRIRHLLPGVPKPMAPVAGRPFLDWVLLHLHAAAGVTDFVLSTGYLAEVVSDHILHQCPSGLTVRCCAETQPLGTAGGFLNCVQSDLRAAPDLWLVANGDSLALADLTPLVAAFTHPATTAALVALRVSDASRYGTIECGPDGALIGFREKRPGAGLVNAGIYAFRHDLLATFPATRPLSFEVDVFPRLLTHHHIAVIEAEAPFLDIGTEATFHAAESFLRSNLHCFAQPPAV